MLCLSYTSFLAEGVSTYFQAFTSGIIDNSVYSIRELKQGEEELIIKNLKGRNQRWMMMTKMRCNSLPTIMSQT